MAIQYATRPGEAFEVLNAYARERRVLSVWLFELPMPYTETVEPFLHYAADDPWPLLYSNRNFRNVDPTLKLIRSLRYPVVTHTMARARTRKNSAAEHMFLEAAALGFEDCATVVQVTENATIGCAAFAAGPVYFTTLSELERLRLFDLGRYAIASEARLSNTTVNRQQLPALSPRALEILPLVVQGLTDREIAALQRCGARTVQTHVTNMYQAFGIPTSLKNKRLALAVAAAKVGISPIHAIVGQPTTKGQQRHDHARSESGTDQEN